MKVFVNLASFCLLIFLSIDSIAQSRIETGFYFLVDNPENGTLVKDVDSEDIFVIESNPELSIHDFKEANISKEKFRPSNIKAIGIKLSKEGKQKWYQIRKRASKTKETIVFVINEKVYVEKHFNLTTISKESYLDLIVDPKYFDQVHEQLETEIGDSR